MRSNSTDDSKARSVTAFLFDYLSLQRNYAQNTMSSYRETLKLFVRYISIKQGFYLNDFQIIDLYRKLLMEFLEWYQVNGTSRSSTNQRLAAIKAFCEYAQIESIESISPCMEVSGIQSKKPNVQEASLLIAYQLPKLKYAPDIRTKTGFKHRAALAHLHDRGFCVQKLCDLTTADVFISEHSAVNIQYHMLFHSKAKHMLEDGINTVCIRNLLVHADISANNAAKISGYTNTRTHSCKKQKIQTTVMKINKRNEILSLQG